MPNDNYPNQKASLETEINVTIDYPAAFGIDQYSGHMRQEPQIKDFDNYWEANHEGIQDVEYRAGLAGRSLPDYVRDLIYNEGLNRVQTDRLQGTFYADEAGRNKIFDGVIDELAERHNINRDQYLDTIDGQIKASLGDKYGSQPLESKGMSRHPKDMFGVEPKYISLRDATLKQNPNYDFVNHIYVDIQENDEVIPVRLDVNSRDVKVDQRTGQISIDEDADVTLFPANDEDASKITSRFATMYQLQRGIETAEVTNRQRAIDELTMNAYDESLKQKANSGPWTDYLQEME